MRKLRIGRLAFLNILPVFEQLDAMGADEKYEFVDGIPTELNRMLLDGDIDISPSSSIEYLRDQNGLTYIDGHSISARGPVRSILLFSRVPIENLEGHEVMATHQSATSVALLEIILRRFHSLNYKLTISDTPVEEAIEKHSAYLAIGDNAIRLSRAALNVDTGGTKPPYKLQSIEHQAFHCYDLSELWYEATGLPMVFALWTMKRDLIENYPKEVEDFVRDLDEARALAKDRLWEIGKKPGLILPPEDAVKYWEEIIYDLPEDCKEGLAKFKKYVLEMGL